MNRDAINYVKDIDLKSITQKLIMLVLASEIARGTNRGCMEFGRLVHYCRLTPQALARHLSALEAKGLLAMHRNESYEFLKLDEWLESQKTPGAGE